ncbi:MAG: PorP/SprF family type IX secretion system membrane protein [Bacteroidetes bacterium]|nr:PorP/SprF family type IX secretion system membrane protein [Bacteroidota bacterium]MBL6962272.1 PorP/SprF family type IX secretion system membrane protein [Bacteroidota bacterium]
MKVKETLYLFNKYSNFLRFRIRIIITPLLVLICLSAKSQDIHFSQFYASPLIKNPADCGDFLGELRIADIYRTQWFTLPIPYVSNAISIDKPIYIRKEHFGIGLVLINDKSGDAELTVSKLYLDLSYHKKIKRQYFHVGIQAGVVNKSISLNAITFPDQYNRLTGFFDPSFPTSDATNGTTFYYPDMNAGIAWKGHFKVVEPEVGVSLYHINKPGENFFGTGNQLMIRKSYYSIVRIDLKGKLDLAPAILFTEHALASELVGGVNLIYMTGKETSAIQEIYGGLYSRNGLNRNFDAAIIQCGLSLKHFDFGISYDLNVSDLSTATNNQGAIEFSVVYKKISSLAFQKTIPCERY